MAGGRLACLLIRLLGVLGRRGILAPVFQHLVAAVLRPAASKGGDREDGEAQHQRQHHRQDAPLCWLAGLHRLEAVKLLGWTEIECVVSEADGLQAELAEIDENFVRAGLSHRGLGDLLLRRKELYEAIHPETRQGQRNEQTAKNANFSLLETKSFAQDTADKLGVSKRTVEQLVQTARDLTPEAKKTIRDAGDKISKGATLKISRLPPDQQEKAAAVLTVAPPVPKRQGMMDSESALSEFKALCVRYVSGIESLHHRADIFAGMSISQLLIGQSSTEGERKKRERMRLQRQKLLPSGKVDICPPIDQVDKCPPILEIRDKEYRDKSLENREGGTRPHVGPLSKCFSVCW